MKTLFQKLKAHISKAHKTSLQCSQGDLSVIIQTDVSKDGLGVCLLQNGKPIAFALESLIDAETQYTNIERELLAVMYVFEHFNTYLYCCSFMIDTDHKPLEMNVTSSWTMIVLSNFMIDIDYKPLEMIVLAILTAAPPCLQRILLQLQQ